SISEIVAPIRVENDRYEVWASAEANYHEGKLEVQLDFFFLLNLQDSYPRPAEKNVVLTSFVPEQHAKGERALA
ncbi:MAG: hypothetical protein WCD63_21690, partial [Terrimicrobiaceae bacterium]